MRTTLASLEWMLLPARAVRLHLEQDYHPQTLSDNLEHYKKTFTLQLTLTRLVRKHGLSYNMSFLPQRFWSGVAMVISAITCYRLIRTTGLRN